mgnify:CR=1 FL=1
MRKRLILVSFSAVIIAALLFTNPLLAGLTESIFLQTESSEEAIPVPDKKVVPAAGAKDDAPIKKNVSRKSYNQLIDDIKGYISDKEGIFGIYFISLTTGQSFGINENEVFTAASTVKVPINLYLFNRIAQNKINPAKNLLYTEEDYEEGTGTIQFGDFGTKYSIRELSQLSIEASDNIAINMLMRYLGRNNILKFMESIVKHPVDKERNVSTPKDMALYLKALLAFREKNTKLGDELLDYMEHTEFNDRMPLYLPENIPVAHKIGTQVKAIHDIGIVFAEKPFILSILSEEVDEELAPEVIAQISRMVYDFEQE